MHILMMKSAAMTAIWNCSRQWLELLEFHHRSSDFQWNFLFREFGSNHSNYFDWYCCCQCLNLSCEHLCHANICTPYPVKSSHFHRLAPMWCSALIVVLSLRLPRLTHSIHLIAGHSMELQPSQYLVQHFDDRLPIKSKEWTHILLKMLHLSWNIAWHGRDVPLLRSPNLLHSLVQLTMSLASMVYRQLAAVIVYHLPSMNPCDDPTVVENQFVSKCSPNFKQFQILN